MIAKEEVVLQNKDVKIEIFLHKNDTLFIRQGVTNRLTIESKEKAVELGNKLLEMMEGAEQVHANNVGESPK